MASHPPIELQTLQAAVGGRAAAFRSRLRLQPAGGAGTRIFPPTFAGAVYEFEQRRRPGRDDLVWCAVLDTVQSQANRVEEALQQALDGGRIELPRVEVDFAAEDLLDPIGRVTALQAPHRIADAIFRDSELDGVSFRQSDVGRPLDSARLDNATPLYELCPTALVFGMWESTGPRGGLGAKFERAYASEIVGIDVPAPQVLLTQKKRGVRWDRLGVRRDVLILGNAVQWQVAADPKAKGAIRPSEINHGNVPFDGDNAGLTMDYAEQTSTLSLIALRRLRFPSNEAASTPERDAAAQTVLAALGLCGATLASDAGYGLRSGCVLWPEAPLTWELLDRPGEQPNAFQLDTESAIRLLREAVGAAETMGVRWRIEPVALKPSGQLVRLVRQSQERAIQAGAESD